MNPCVKTGARVWIESHNAIANGDLYRVGEVYLYVHVSSDVWDFSPNFEEVMKTYAHFYNRHVQRAQQYSPFPLEHWFANQKIIALLADYVEILKK